jgi:predicted Fe-Mo cluster-binding NifX family protein
MKIAVPTNGNAVDDHFGHCEYFTVFTVDGEKKIISEERVDSPAGCGCKSNIVHTLADKGVTMMLAGNIGDGAIRVLGSKDIQVVRGCSGAVRDVAEKWLSGVLVDSGDTCHQHEHGCHE